MWVRFRDGLNDKVICSYVERESINFKLSWKKMKKKSPMIYQQLPVVRTWTKNEVSWEEF